MSESVLRVGNDPQNDGDSTLDGSWLDREHQARISRVANCDAADGRRAAAENEMGGLTEDEQELSAQRKAQGGDEHIAAIELSAWFPYLSGIRMGSRLAWFLDSLFWGTLWVGLWWLWKTFYDDTGETAPVILYPALLLALIAAPLCARGVKGFGQHFAVTRRTDPDSVRATIDRQVRLAGALAGVGFALVLGVVALLCFVPPSWSSWVTYVSGLVTFAANVCLGFSSGIGGNVADLLEKPAVRDSIDCQIEMKQRTRLQLRKFLAVLAFIGVVFLSAHPVAIAAEPTWIWAIDVSDSLDPAQREAGIEAMIEVAPTRSRTLGVSLILVVRFSEESLLAEMTWVRVPPAPPNDDCTKVKPKRVVSKGLINLSPHLAVGQRDEAIERCLARQAGAQHADAQRQQALREQLRVATRVIPRTDVTTRIAPLLQTFLGRAYTRAIDVLTDGIDHSGMSPATLRINEGVDVVMLITRPNPKRAEPTLSQVLSAAEMWGRVDGIQVTSVAEYPGLWSGRGAL